MRWVSTTRIAGNRLLSPTAYWLATALGFVMLVLFAVALIAAYVYWHRLAWPARIGMGVAVIVLTPSVDDVRSLFIPYDVYSREWENHHRRNPT